MSIIHGFFGISDKLYSHAFIWQHVFSTYPPPGETDGGLLLDRFRATSMRGRSRFIRRRKADPRTVRRQNVISTLHGLGQIAGCNGRSFQGLAEGKRSVYTCPIKALVNEKWMTPLP